MCRKKKKLAFVGCSAKKVKPQCRPQPIDPQAPPRRMASLGGDARAPWAALGPPESLARRRDRQPLA